ncbi:hypothetical protein MNBD_GAMMA24-2133 [hydrothermal vent metagenome]|uniref:Transporter n=1 Tax=hydrothermal vent metagenome TaxID=652676 RepID=A0A3B1B515_9ZZZZ
MFNKKLKRYGLMVLLTVVSTSSFAHDPVFGIGPHVVFKDGFEIATDLESDKRAGNKEQSLSLEVTYGLTGDWSLGADLPYTLNKKLAENNSNGTNDISVFTKYRFWRQDSLGLQRSAAVLLKMVSDTAARNKIPRLNKDATDAILGLTYGYEGRRWYRWASARYRYNGSNKTGLNRGDKILIDFVAGFRPTPTGYLQPDTVWLLELNGEYTQQDKLSGRDLLNSGGTEWFVSPGIFWTYRYFAIKAGVQIPVYHALNGLQKKTDYRARLIFEWHL